jgi:arsenate reductase (thioredoxin)
MPIAKQRCGRPAQWTVSGVTVSNTILFLCPHNAAKSVIAAAYFNRLAGQEGLPFTADSAGTEPATVVSAAVAALLQREGMDVSQHQPRPVTPNELAAAYRVISMGCTPEALGLPPDYIDQWLDIPLVSENLSGAREAIQRHVAALVIELSRR